ncbi:hypothetical protein NMY22_g9592 [Coprinellus aureogranulatus]|nr:hypothetical protein NMY22_g9592 [Coprinellus aureogranulatus]
MSASSSQLIVPSRSGTPSSSGEKGNVLSADFLEQIRTSSKFLHGPLKLPTWGSQNKLLKQGEYYSLVSSWYPLTSNSRAPSEAGRSASPSSDMGYGSDDKSPHKGKGRGQYIRVLAVPQQDANSVLDEDSYTLKRKRGTSPQISPTKKAKGRPSGSPISRVKADGDGSGVASNQPAYSPATHSHSRIPSKLRDSSTAPYNHRSPGSSSSRESSPGAPTPSATSSFTQSPNLSTRVPPGGQGGGPRGRGRPLGSGTGPPKRSPPTQVQRPPLPQVMHSHYGMDVDEGEETGSSTDTSESS